MERRENGLKQIRLQCNFSQGYLADKLMVTRQTISEWEKGKKRIPDGRKKELSEYFGVDAKYLSELNVEERQELLKLPVYWYRDKNKDYFLYKDQTSLGRMNLEARTETFDEEYAKLQKEINIRFDMLRGVYLRRDDICICDKIQKCKHIIRLLDNMLVGFQL